MILKQFYLNCLAHASYLIGDEQYTHRRRRRSPARHRQYLAFAAEHKLQIKHVFLTHLHADFIAGHLGTSRSRRRQNLSRRCRQSRIRLHPARRWRHHRIRPRPPESARNSRPHSRIHLHPRLRSQPQRLQPNAVLTGDTLLHRRRRPSRSPRRARLVRHRSRRHALRFPAHQTSRASPTQASSIPRTAPARSAAKPSARKPSPPSASSAASITRSSP